jgi:hypothetical protein
VRDAKIDANQISQFAASTDEALFLFDARLAGYLAALYSHAIRLRTVGLLMDKAADADRTRLIEEDAELLIWFTEQFEEMRARFAPFLHIADR